MGPTACKVQQSSAEPLTLPGCTDPLFAHGFTGEAMPRGVLRALVIQPACPNFN